MLPELKVLFVQGNDIVRVEGLNACYKLRELVMDKNRIKFVDADGFSGLTNLRELRLEENGLRSLSNFNLPNLQSLYLGLNRVNDLAELDKLSSIPFLMELSLNSNPVARKQLYRANAIRRLPTLKVSFLVWFGCWPSWPSFFFF
jgi:Leucine-rich repeat (LRR) protein|tara:strand:- start:11 stop:445 length:435 start_codon:yes stop_codon:yes gene_type:complete